MLNHFGKLLHYLFRTVSNKFKAFLNFLTAKGISIAELKPYNMTEEHIKEINFYFIDGYLMIKLKGQDN